MRMMTTLKVLFTLSITVFSCLTTSAAEPPNILFIIADDASRDSMGIYGSTYVETPNFDRIAREGVLFTQAYNCNPKCAPARACLLTGRYSWQLQEACNHNPFLSDQWAFYPFLLEDAGYCVGYTGKGWGPGEFRGYDASRTKDKINPAGHPFLTKKLKPPYKGIRNTDYAGNFEDFLAKSSDEKPFCFWLGTSEPHRYYQQGSGKLSGKDPSKVVVPAIFPDNDIVRNDILDYLVEVEHFDKMVTRAILSLEKSGQLGNTIVVVTSDHGMPFPRAKASLYDAGSKVPLAIRWPKGIKNPGRDVNAFVNLSDLAATFLEAAGLPIPKMMNARSMMDLFADQESKKRDAAYIAMERHDGCRKGGKGYPCRAIRTSDYLYIHNFEPSRWPSGSPDPSVCARAIPYGEIDSSPTKTFMMENRNRHGVAHLAELAFGMRPAEELYDIKTDPHQLHNLAGSIQHEATQQSMRQRLFDHLKETKDPRMVGGKIDWDYYPYYGSRKNKDWTVDKKP